MPTYNYKCPSCGHTYAETRTVEESQYKIICNGCKSDNYVEEA